MKIVVRTHHKLPEREMVVSQHTSIHTGIHTRPEEPSGSPRRASRPLTNAHIVDDELEHWQLPAIVILRRTEDL
jgi:hypothetical protein